MTFGRTPRLLLAAACGALVLPALALGPLAPFVPPGKDSATEGALALGATPARDAAPSGLSGVRLGRHAGALIDGLWIAQGAAVRGAKLESIKRDRVLLRHPDGRGETLTLYPATAAPAASAAASAASTASAER